MELIESKFLTLLGAKEMSNNMWRRLLVSCIHKLALVGVGGGLRAITRKMAVLYAAQAKSLDEVIILDEKENEGISWSLFRRKIEDFQWPEGVCSDAIPNHEPWRCDAVGCHRNALVVGIHPTAFSSDGSACKLMRYDVFKPFVKGHLRTSDLVAVERWLCGRDVNGISVEKAIILDEQMGHFGHWLFEQLPQLRLLKEIDDIYLIINGMDQWKRALLLDFGWPENRLLSYCGSEVFEVGELWTTNGGNLNSKDLQWLRDMGIRSYGQDRKAPRRIYVSRQGVGSRAVSNFDEIKPVLDDFGIVVVQPELLGVDRSVGMFSNAEFIIGPEGSGMRNMIWSKQCTVVEIFGHEVNYGQWSLAYALGFEFIPYVERRERPNTNLRWRDIDANGITVDPALFREFLSYHLMDDHSHSRYRKA